MKHWIKKASFLSIDIFCTVVPMHILANQLKIIVQNANLPASQDPDTVEIAGDSTVTLSKLSNYPLLTPKTSLSPTQNAAGIVDSTMPFYILELDFETYKTRYKMPNEEQGCGIRFVWDGSKVSVQYVQDPHAPNQACPSPSSNVYYYKMQDSTQGDTTTYTISICDLANTKACAPQSSK